MKKLIIFCIAVVMITVSSCSDYMEFPPSVSFNLDSVFTKYNNAEKMLFDMYNYPIPMNFDNRGFGSNGTRMGGGTFASALTDEGQSFDVQPGYQVQRYYTGNVEPSTCASWSSAYKGEDDYSLKWVTIRKAYIMLNNIDRVPDNTFPTTQGYSPKAQKERIKAEAKLMIALVYFEMLKRYGGVPIIKREFSLTDGEDYYRIPRATFEETYNFIISLIEDVQQNYDALESTGEVILPARITVPVEFGRFPMAFAYTLKARVELYAASPLFNTASPYSKALGAKSNLICFMNYNRERWKKAADAASVAIDYCLANGYKLVDVETNRANGMNYTVANIEYPAKGNTEVIWGISQSPTNWQNYTLVRGITNGFYGYASNLVPVNQVERYELKAATSGQYKSWDAMQTFPITGTTGADAPLKVAAAARKPYEGLDPRFNASIAYNGLTDYGNEPYLDMADAFVDSIAPNGASVPVPYKDKNGTHSTATQRTTIVHFVRKFTRGYDKSESTMRPLNIYMRLAELYLIRAEALNEYYDAPDTQVYDDLNIIRTRSAMPNVLPNQTQAQMRETIEHERNIEMFYEDQRWFDLRRTLKSEQKIPVKIYKIQIRKWYKYTVGANGAKVYDNWPYKITYEKVFYMKRVWYNHWYMNPFPSQEVDKGYGIIQNPGW